MKSIFVLFICLFVNIFIANINADEGPTGLKFNVKKISPVTYDFRFKYSGKIRIEPTRLFLGYVPKNSILNLYPNLVNGNNDTLFIDDIRPSCSCTEVGYERGKIAPNNKKRLEVFFNSRGFAINKWIRKSVWVFSQQIPNKGRIRFFYESIISFDSAMVVPETKVVNINKKSVSINVKSKRHKKIGKLGFYTTTPEYFDVVLPNSLKKGKNSIKFIQKKKVSKLFKTSVTIYSEADSTCDFSLPVYIYPH